MKERFFFIFLILAFSTYCKKDSLSNMRSLKQRNCNRINTERKLVDNTFRNNPLIFSSDKIESLVGHSDSKITPQDLMLDFQNSKDSSEFFTFFLKNVKNSLLLLKNSVLQKLENVNDLLGSNIWKN